jgi:glucans biosynthesis protein C
MGQESSRYHSLDAVRATALLLGIVFHAAESFCPDRWSWAVVDPQAHSIFAFFQHTLHSFRMEVFFLIAGFFAHLVFHRRGLRTFVRHRTQRILVPFVVGWVVLYPLMILIWIWGRMEMGRPDLLGLPPQLAHLSVFQIWIGHFITGAFLGQGFNLLHLWFLYYLLLLYVTILGGRWLWALADHSSRGRELVDRAIAWTLGVRWPIALLALVTVPVLSLMGGWVRTPNESLVPDLPVLLAYGLFFGLGWMLDRQTHLLSHFRRSWCLNLILGLILSVVSFFGRDISLFLGPSGQFSTVLPILFQFLYATTMWSFVFGFMGLFMTCCRDQSFFWRYIADSSYWLYMVHLILVVPLQILASEIAWSGPVKYLAINIVALPVLFLSYNYLVRNTFIGAQLNGRRYARVELSAALPRLRAGWKRLVLAQGSDTSR